MRQFSSIGWKVVLLPCSSDFGEESGSEGNAVSKYGAILEWVSGKPK